ncbi:MAG: hypothetical protein EKK39_04360 [Sphingobacteriales bacterium]|nr:MAG: hypothetical protein EKK39_04360 [Sphingobacteriales bacterium]
MRKKLLMVFSALLLLFAGVHAQTVTITGKVTDDKGKPIDGASIVDKKQSWVPQPMLMENLS